MLKNIIIFSLLLIVGCLIGKDKILSMVNRLGFMVGNTSSKTKSNIPKIKKQNDAQSDFVNEKLEQSENIDDAQSI